MSDRFLKNLSRVGVGLVVAQLLLLILSWLLSATRLEGVRSLLSSEGIRWFIGEFTHTVASPGLVWLLLLLVAGGCLHSSGLLSYFSLQLSISYRRRVALRVSIAFLIIYIGIISLLTLMPHAILLSASGSLWASAFSRALVAIIAFGLCLVGLTFGIMSGRLRSLADVLEALSFGIRQAAPLFIIYILFIQFYASLLFVFN